MQSISGYNNGEGFMSHTSLHVPGEMELWLITTLCLYGILRQVGYIYI